MTKPTFLVKLALAVLGLMCFTMPSGAAVYEELDALTDLTEPANAAVNAITYGPAYSATYPGTKAFDNGSVTVESSRWLISTANITAGNAWVTYQFTVAPVVVNAYRIWNGTKNNVATAAPKDFTFEGSLDGSSWVLLDSRAGETGWSDAEKRDFIFINRTAYAYYRFKIVAHNGFKTYGGIGELEFFDITWDDALMVKGLPSEYGNPLPVYGPTNGLAEAASFTCSAGSAVTNATGDRTGCIGYTLHTNENVLVQSGSETSFTYTHATVPFSTLTWLWKQQYQFTFFAITNGTVANASGWYNEGTTVTLTPIPDAGYRFLKWTGDVPGGMSFDSALELHVDQSRSVTATFISDSVSTTKTWMGSGDNATWDDPANWNPVGVPSLNDAVYIISPADILISTSGVAGALSIASGAAVHVAGTGATITTHVPLDPESTATNSLSVVENLELAGRLSIGGRDHLGRAILSVGGDLTLSGGAVLAIYAGYEGEISSPDTYRNGGAVVEVAGETLLEGTSAIYPFCHRQSGAPVQFALHDLTVDSGAKIDASVRGWSVLGSGSTGTYYGKGVNTGYRQRGGSYGGRGGNSTDSYCYGFEYAPFYPGSPGYYSTETLGIGGGAIRIDADNVVLEGKLLANGNEYKQVGYAAGSGGGIWITCSTFTPGEQARIEATSEDAGYSTGDGYGSGGGGGGRVAIMTGQPTVEQIDALYETGTCDNMTVLVADLNDVVYSPWPTLVNVEGSINTSSFLGTYDPNHQAHGRPGTSVLLMNKGNSVAVEISGTLDPMSTTPAYGTHVLPKGEHVFQADSVSFAPGSSDLMRYHCAGYTWSNALKEVGSGSTNEVSLTLNSDTWINWLWNTPEHRLSIRSGGNGVVTEYDGTPEVWLAAGSSHTVTAQADSGSRFLYWVGDLPYADRFQTSLNVTLDVPKELIACFTSNDTAGRDLVWTGSESTDWFDPMNWNESAIPGVYDRVLISSNICTVGYPVEMTLASLSLAGTGTRLEIGASGSFTTGSASCLPVNPDETRPYALTVSGDLSLANTAKMVIGGWKGESPIDLSVGGDLFLANTAMLEICAGYTEDFGEAYAYQIYQTGGARVTVSGTTTLADSSIIIPVCHPMTGAPVIFNLRDLNVATGASFNANYRGFGRVNTYSETGVLSVTYYGLGKPLIPRPLGPLAGGAGGSYGGIAGGAASVGPAYGTPSAPFYPGSPGDDANLNNVDDYTRWAGGAIRINARYVTLEGNLTAISQEGSTYACSGSGGGIWVTCEKFTLGGTGVKLNASASNSYRYSTRYGGSGGRIAIAEGLSAFNLNTLYRTGECSGATVYPMEGHEVFDGRFNVAGGLGYPNGPTDGEPGTAIFMVGPPSGTLITVR